MTANVMVVVERQYDYPRPVVFRPDVFVARQRITGDPGIDPDSRLELRVEFTKTGRNGTLVRIVQGPYEPEVATQTAVAPHAAILTAAPLTLGEQRRSC